MSRQNSKMSDSNDSNDFKEYEYYSYDNGNFIKELILLGDNFTPFIDAISSGTQLYDTLCYNNNSSKCREDMYDRRLGVYIQSRQLDDNNRFSSLPKSNNNIEYWNNVFYRTIGWLSGYIWDNYVAHGDLSDNNLIYDDSIDGVYIIDWHDTMLTSHYISSRTNYLPDISLPIYDIDTSSGAILYLTILIDICDLIQSFSTRFQIWGDYDNFSNDNYIYKINDISTNTNIHEIIKIAHFIDTNVKEIKPFNNVSNDVRTNMIYNKDNDMCLRYIQTYRQKFIDINILIRKNHLHNLDRFTELYLYEPTLSMSDVHLDL
jgi:hypothetical protein